MHSSFGFENFLNWSIYGTLTGTTTNSYSLVLNPKHHIFKKILVEGLSPLEGIQSEYFKPRSLGTCIIFVLQYIFTDWDIRKLKWGLHTLKQSKNLRGKVANVLDCDLVVSEFELNSLC